MVNNLFKKTLWGPRTRNNVKAGTTSSIRKYYQMVLIPKSVLISDNR